MSCKVKLVAIAKDESRYLAEWVFHHAYFGFDSFDIYINNTTDCSIEILDKLSLEFDINVIDADVLYQSKPESFQSRAYNHALENTDSNKYSHVAFLDIDEFWTPNDFITPITTYLAKSTDFDIILFNWAIHQSESTFKMCFSNSNRFVLDNHVKYIVKLGKKLKAGIHNAHGRNLSYVTSDFQPPEFIDKSNAKIKVGLNLPDAFIVHRLYRSQVEYVSMLSRGRPRGDRFKSNRHGYYKNNSNALEFVVNDKLLSSYSDAFALLIKRSQLGELLAESERFVIKRKQELLVTIENGVTQSEAVVLIKALRNVTLPEIKKYLNMIEIKEGNMKIFQIGFNKSGTGSMYQYFKGEGFKSAHWEKGNLSKTINANFKAGQPLLKGYENYQVFTDMEHREEDQTAVYSAEKFFKEFDKQYPGSLFILNYRDINKWVNSRVNHRGYLKKTMLSKGLTEIEVIEQWKLDYQQHIKAVELYFQGKNNLIILNLDEDDSDKLYKELSLRGIKLKSKELPHSHKTKTKSRNEKLTKNQIHTNAIRDAALFFEDKDIQVAYKLMKIANQLRPEGKLIKDKLNKFEAKLTSVA